MRLYIHEIILQLMFLTEFDLINVQFHYEADEFCCEWCPIKDWWRHYLTTVEMDNFEDLDERNSVQNFFIQNAKGIPSFIYL